MFFKEKKGDTKTSDLARVAALLIHAAKIDENYSSKEKLIISNFIKSIDDEIKPEEVINKAEIDEAKSNQILNYTQEIKKNTLEFKKKIVKILWKIILSDDNPDIYENTLMRRIAGLLYVPDKIIGEAKLEIINKK